MMGLKLRRILTTIGALGFLSLAGFTTGCSDDPASGCKSDQECRGTRICVQGRCVSESVDDDATTADTGTVADSGTVADTGTSLPDTGHPNPDTVIEDTGSPIDTSGPDPDTGSPADTMNFPDHVAPDTSTQPDIGPDGGGTVGPQIKVVPRNQIDFGGTVVNSSSTQSVKISNVGDMPLKLSNIGLRQTPSQGFSVNGPSSPPTLSPNKSVTYKITFKPNQMGRFRNHFDIQSNDPDPNDQQIGVQLDGSGFNKVNQPCLFSTPDSIDYGVVKPGNKATRSVTIGNCSQSDTVTVTTYQWNSNPNNVFSIHSSTPSPPFKVQPGQTKTVKITFTSKSRRSLTGQLSIRSDETVGGGDIVDLKASGGGCAEAEAKGQDPGESHDTLRDGPIPVPPKHTIKFSGKESTSPSGKLGYKWSLAKSPSGSSASLKNASSATPEIKPDKPGVYEVKLSVTDTQSGQAGCTTDTVELVALKSNPEIEVEMDWTGDHNLDLHVVRSTTGGSFPSFGTKNEDVYADQQEQDWGKSNDRQDNAYLLGDDGKGQDPERAMNREKVMVGTVASNRKYRVAVHFRDNEGPRPRRVPINISVTLKGSTKQLSHNFYTFQRGGGTDVNRYWISFDLDGSNTSIKKVDKEQ